MKRKKWTEEEEAALIREYSELAASGALARLKTRERKFQPIADRVSALHHLRDPVSFRFRWSWRDVSIKIQNMRHQYLGVKQKIRLPHHLASSSSASAPGSCFDWSAGEHHWPNFLLYKQVFGDADLDAAPSTSAVGVVKANAEAGGEVGEEEGDEGEDNDNDGVAMDDMINDEDEVAGSGVGRSGTGEAKSGSGIGVGGEGRLGLSAAKSLVELGQALLNREERRRERDRKAEDRAFAALCKREREHQREMDETAAMHDRGWRWSEERKDWWRREQRWEEEEMEWRERVLGMQMEHEKHMMQMHLDACQAQAQMLGFLARLVSQLLGSAGGGDGGLVGLSNQALHNLQQQQQQQQQQEQHHRQQDPASMNGDTGKTGASAAGPYI